MRVDTAATKRKRIVKFRQEVESGKVKIRQATTADIERLDRERARKLSPDEREAA